MLKVVRLVRLTYASHFRYDSLTWNYPKEFSVFPQVSQTTGASSYSSLQACTKAH